MTPGGEATPTSANVAPQKVQSYKHQRGTGMRENNLRYSEQRIDHIRQQVRLLSVTSVQGLPEQDIHPPAWDSNRNPNGKRKREAKNAEVDEALYRWYVNAKARSAPVSGPILKEKARALAEGLGCEDFKPSDGWLGRWKTRHNISTRRGNADSSSRFVADRPVEDTQQETTDDRGGASVKADPTHNDDDPSHPATAASQEVHSAETATEEAVCPGARSDSTVRVEPANCANVQPRAVPTLSEVEEAIDVIRRWMRFHNLQHSPMYGTLLAIERNIYDHFRKAKKQKSIAQYFKPISK
ncbi:PREDICTED: uncharacterized protein LOC109473305 [Branchiostoma belcheri]|uniref:Uncharacterized protein LOC109473305 n=1 Tax=Branchiostoma belcheri TaxID=7741 RepID=A0A6P4ZCB8_BRABE|nr:PREDICTED: uncharacterized protein LOC109473305 [Branchiostoma belcheri]